MKNLTHKEIVFIIKHSMIIQKQIERKQFYESHKSYQGCVSRIWMLKVDHFQVFLHSGDISLPTSFQQGMTFELLLQSLLQLSGGGHINSTF